MKPSITAVSAASYQSANCSPAHRLQAGLDHYRAGRYVEAIAAFQFGIDEAEADADSDARVSMLAELHFKLGNSGMLISDLDLAASHYSAVLGLTPDHVACWCNLGNVYMRWSRPGDAIAFYMKAISLDAGHWPSRTNLAQALIDDRHLAFARALLLELATERPNDAQVHHQLGKLHAELDEDPLALASFERAVALDPADADSLYWIGSLRLRGGDVAAAEAIYRRASVLKPLIRQNSASQPPGFRVLSLFAPSAGNTPTEYLLGGSDYETNTLALFKGRDDDLDMLRQNGDVVVNLISDADQGQEMLPLAADLVDMIGRPTVNHPRLIQLTTREKVATLLTPIAGCRIPKVVRLGAGMGLVEAKMAAADFEFPFLARLAGTHGGDDFDKIENQGEFDDFLQRHGDHDRYLIDYFDYRSADGYFRKYRFIFVDKMILPYHLAIGSDWKLHHDSTDMANHQWMQQEEAAFLDNPAAFFGGQHFQALDAIRAAMGLDYFGIDCGLSGGGELVVFEVNASMLVHHRNDDFPYKTPYVERIKREFDSMLTRLSRQ